MEGRKEARRGVREGGSEGRMEGGREGGRDKVRKAGLVELYNKNRILTFSLFPPPLSLSFPLTPCFFLYHSFFSSHLSPSSLPPSPSLSESPWSIDRRYSGPCTLHSTGGHWWQDGGTEDIRPNR